MYQKFPLQFFGLIPNKCMYITLLCLLSILTIKAQTPTNKKTPEQATNSTINGNTFPFGNSAILTTNGIKWQTLYPFTYLTPTVTSVGQVVNKIYVRSLNTPTAASPLTAGSTTTISNLNIKLGVVTDTSYTGTTFLTGLTQCANYASITLAPPTVAGGWIEIPLQTPFVIASLSGSIVVEMTMTTKTASNGFGVAYTAATSNRRLAVATAGALTATTGIVSTTWTDMGFEINGATPCTKPSNQPTAFTSIAISTTQINASFTTATSNPDNYLVVRYPSGSTPTSPVDGTNYTIGASLSAGIVVSNTSAISFSNTGLIGGTSYDHYIYSFNSACSGGPNYLTTNPLVGTASTMPCNGGASIISVTASPNTICIGDTATLNLTTLALGSANVSTFAGSGTAGSADGIGVTSSFNSPSGIATDAAGNVYVADYLNRKIRKITNIGVVTTLAGSGAQGNADGIGTAASFNFPSGIATDAIGNVYVADFGNHNIRKITNSGAVTTLAGSGAQGSANGIGTAASFNGPSDVAVDAAGNVYVADRYTYKIRKITNTGVVTTFAGSGAFGSTDGIGTVASFSGPTGIAVDAAGNVFVCEKEYHKIRKITNTGVVTTLAGSGFGGSADGLGTAASFYFPTHIADDAAGNIFVTDQANHKIRKITSTGVVTTLAGSGGAGSVDGIGTAASFNYPLGISIDASDNIYVADGGNYKIRKIVTQLPQTYSWSPSSTLLNPTTTNPKAFPATTTIYTVTASSANGCTVSTITVIVKPNYTITSSAGINGIISSLGNTSICQGNNKMYTITPNSNYQIADVLVDGVSVGAVSTYIFSNVSAPHTISASFSLIAPCVMPSNQPTAFTSTAISTTQINVSFTAATSNPDNYLVVRYPSGSTPTSPVDGTNYTVGSSLSAGIVVSNTSAISFNNIGLIGGTSYDYYIYSFNNACSGGPNYLTSNPLLGSASTCSIPGNQPTSFLINSISTNSVSFTFTAAASNPSGYLVVRYLKGSAATDPINNTAYSVGSSLGNGLVVSNASSIITDNGLQNGYSYNYYIYSYNNCNGNLIYLNTNPTVGTISTCAAIPNISSINASSNVICVGDSSTLLVSNTESNVVVSTHLVGAPSPSFYYANGLAINASGDIFVAENANNMIRKITPQGVVTTYAGGNSTISAPNYSENVATDNSGNVYYTSGYSSHDIYRITPSGVTSIFAGSSSSGSANGTGTSASFNNPKGIAIDGNGNLYVADRGNNKIRKITPTGVVTNFAGSGVLGSSDGPGTIASFYGLNGITIDNNGNVFVAEANHKVRKITPVGLVSTIAGSGVQGSADGIGTAATFYNLSCITVDVSGNVFVGDGNNFKIRKITSTGVVGTFAGNGLVGSTNGISTNATFADIRGIVADASGNIYVSDANRIRKITPTGVVSTFAGSGANGSANGIGSSDYYQPIDLVSDSIGNLFFFDQNKIQKISVNGVVSTLAGSGNYQQTGSFTDGVGSNATFGGRGRIAIDKDKNLYVVNGGLRKITPTGVVTTIFPYNSSYSLNGEKGIVCDSSGNIYTIGYSGGNWAIIKITPTGSASIFAGGSTSPGIHSQMSGMAIDMNGNLYVADYGYDQILKITQSGIITTFASGYNGAFSNISDIECDANGLVYACSYRELFKYSLNGIKIPVAGSGSSPFGVTNGIGSSARFNTILGLTMDALGNIFVADYGNFMIRKIVTKSQSYAWNPSSSVINTNTDSTKAFPTSTTIFTVTASNGTGCTITSTVTVSISPCSSNVELTCYLEGMYDVATHQLVPALSNSGIAGATNLQCDSIEVSLRRSASPFGIVQSVKEIVATNGQITCMFNNVPVGESYYIVMRHRNSIETWSASPITLYANTSYDFTTSANRAYGNNQIQKEPGIFAIYSGDINQDGAVNNIDFSIWETDANGFVSGYIESDLDGNGATDNIDFSIWEANANGFVSVLKP
jgi:mucin-19